MEGRRGVSGREEGGGDGISENWVQPSGSDEDTQGRNRESNVSAIALLSSANARLNTALMAAAWGFQGLVNSAIYFGIGAVIGSCCGNKRDPLPNFRQ